MVDINLVRNDPEKFKQNLKNRQMLELAGEVDWLLELDQERRELIQEVEALKARQNELSSQIGKSRDSGLIKEAAGLKGKIQELEPRLAEVEEEFSKLLWQMPNWLHESVPLGTDESENKVLRSWGEPASFGFKPKDHVEIGRLLDLIDVEASAQVAGARFNYLKNEAVLIQFGLIRLAFDLLLDQRKVGRLAKSVNNPFDNPFVPVIPPVLMKPEIMGKMGRLDPLDERFYIEKDDLVMVGSAEHTLGPMHMDQKLNESELPVRYVGYSTSFRREAGSYGKDTRGILRVHQFDKIEMETFIQPEYSVAEQDLLVAVQERLMQQLEIPYQVVAICTGDMGAPDYRQIDIEAWIPSQGRYRETHTADLMTDYQARRLNIKYRGKKGRQGYVHMNDATVFAIGRTLIAILENYQQEDGSVVVPKILQEYVGKEVIGV